MSNPSNQTWRDPEEYEREYHQDLIEQAKANVKNRRVQALELRNIALKCLDRGVLSFTHYVDLCQRNNVSIF